MTTRRRLVTILLGAGTLCLAAGCGGGDDPSGPAGSAPVFTTQPQSRTVVAGTNAVFSAAVSGTPPFTFQWKRNGGDYGARLLTIGAANTFGLTIPATVGDDGSRISLEVWNDFGRVTSNEVTLTVTPP